MSEQVFIFLCTVALSFLVASWGKTKKIGFGWSLAFSLIFSPVIGFIIVLFSSKKKNKDFVEEK
jgi:hypothetical protein